MVGVSTFFLSSCQLFEERPSSESAKKTPTNWETRQEKEFGKFDYLDISQEEAEAILIKKFSVRLPDEYAKGVALLHESLQTKENNKEQPTYFVKATGNTLVMKGTFAYKNSEDQKYYSYGTVELIYQYNESLKKSWLEAQELSIDNYTGNQCMYINDPIPTIEKIGQLAAIENVQQKITHLAEVLQKKPEDRMNQEIYLENSMKTAQAEQTIGKNIGIYFDENGTLEKLFMYIKVFV